MKTSSKFLFVAAAISAACSTADEGRPEASDFDRVAVVQDDVKATVVASDAAGVEVSRALLRRDHEVARVEVELEGDRFAAELDPVTGEITIHAEADGASTSWSPSSGETMPEAVSARWAAITGAWRATLLDDTATLREEFRGAINAPADLFTTPDADVPVSQTVWCPEPVCWYDSAAEIEVCQVLYQVWCPPPPPPPPPCGGWCPPDPCWGFFCPDPCAGGRCDPPCVGLWCEPPCWGDTCGCQPWDPFCSY